MVDMVEVQRVEVPSETVAVVRSVVPAERLSVFFADAFGRVADAVPVAGGQVAGPPFAWYHGMPGETFDVSAGFPVSGDVHVPDGGVHVLEREGGRAVMAVHEGAYERLGETWGELARSLRSDDSPREDFWEEYLTEPTGDPSQLRTRLVQPLR